MVVLPALQIVTVPLVVTVATAWLLLLIYVKVPLLLLVGAVRLNGNSRKFLGCIDHAPIVGATLFTVKLAVCDPAPKSNDEFCIAVTVAGVPASVAEEIVTTRRFVGTLTFTYEMVPRKFSPAQFCQPPMLTGPLLITFAPTLNGPVCVAPVETVRNVSVIVPELCAAVNT